MIGFWIRFFLLGCALGLLGGAFGLAGAIVAVGVWLAYELTLA
jgi:hypothetical protein